MKVRGMVDRLLRPFDRHHRLEAHGPTAEAAAVPYAVEFERSMSAHDREMAAIGAMVSAIRGDGLTLPPSSTREV